MKIGFRLTSLALRLVGPVIIVCLVGGYALYATVQRNFSNFTERQIGQLMRSLADDVYTICDGSWGAMTSPPPARDQKEVRIRKARTLAVLEDFFRQKGLQGFIVADGRRIPLNREMAPDLQSTLEQGDFDDRVAMLSHAGKRYAVVHQTYDVWDWRIVLAKERIAYAALSQDIRSLYTHLAYVIALGFLVILIALEETVRKPIRAIIESVRKGNQPVRTGVSEFDYLAEQLQWTIQKRNVLLVNLEQTHFIYSHDIHGNFTYLSPSITAILGYMPEEFQTHYTTYLTDHPVNREVARHTTLSVQGKQQPPYEVEIFHRNGSRRWLEVTEVPVFSENGAVIAVEGIARDISDKKQVLQEKEQLIAELQKAMAEIKTLHGIIPICASCKKVRDDEGAWQQLESYIQSRSDAQFSHGICPECLDKMYPGLSERPKKDR
jgi:PAS domain S-box-containing protein